MVESKLTPQPTGVSRTLVDSKLKAEPTGMVEDMVESKLKLQPTTGNSKTSLTVLSEASMD